LQLSHTTQFGENFEEEIIRGMSKERKSGYCTNNRTDTRAPNVCQTVSSVKYIQYMQTKATWG